MFLMCFSVLVGTMFKNHASSYGNIFSLKVRKIIIMMLYDKVGKINLETMINSKSEKLVTLIASDL